MSAVYLVVGAVAILGAVHLFHANDELGLTKRSSSSYEDTLVRLGHRSEETSDFDDRIEKEHDLSFRINEMLDQVIELGKTSCCINTLLALTKLYLNPNRFKC